MRKTKELDRLQNGKASLLIAFSLTEVFSAFHTWSLSGDFCVTLLLSPSFVYTMIYLIILFPNLKVVYIIFHQTSPNILLILTWKFLDTFFSLFPCPSFRPSSSSAWVLLKGSLHVVPLTTLTTRWILVEWSSIPLDLNLKRHTVPQQIDSALSNMP